MILNHEMHERKHNGKSFLVPSCVSQFNSSAKCRTSHKPHFFSLGQNDGLMILTPSF